MFQNQRVGNRESSREGGPLYMRRGDAERKESCCCNRATTGYNQSHVHMIWVGKNEEKVSTPTQGKEQ